MYVILCNTEETRVCAFFLTFNIEIYRARVAKNCEFQIYDKYCVSLISCSFFSKYNSPLKGTCTVLGFEVMK